MSKEEKYEALANGEYGMDKTIVSRMLENKDLLRRFMSLSEHTMVNMLDKRRANVFSPVWENDYLEREQVIKNVKSFEDGFLEEMAEEDEDDVLPGWLLKMEAQDIMVSELLAELDNAGGDEDD